jgi:hypothetical protein
VNVMKKARKERKRRDMKYERGNDKRSNDGE